MSSTEHAKRPPTPPTPGQSPCGPPVACLTSAKVRDSHWQRQAIVYIRQSTPQQVLNNRESADLQYGLEHRAAQLGWPASQVEVVDEDQGKSGKSAEGRPGFQYLLAEVALGHVGLILGLEMSRLARSNKDWHQLLDLCAIFDTLLADADGVYDPKDYNDRLLLGLKGAMSEAELHLLRNRMYNGLLNKAKKGEVYNHPPIGYVKSPDGGFALDPDEQAQAVVRLIFDLFDREGSVQAVLRYLVKHKLDIPVRPFCGSQRGLLQWHRPNRVSLHSMLEHPIYAGYYRWGHRAVDPRKKVAGRPHSGRTKRQPNDCLVLLADHCPAYISQERFWANQQRLKANRCGPDTPGAPRHGPSLLGGLLVCGRCGYRLMVNYNSSGHCLRYVCSRGHVTYGEPECQSLAGGKLDEFVSAQVLAALEPAALELHLQAAADVEGQRRQLHQQWQQKLQRADYQTQRAMRQYQEVEPEHRLVARELERRWEEAMQQQQQLQKEYEQFCRTQPAVLSEQERQQIRVLASDLPQLWQAETTTAQDRKRVVRLLIERVVVAVQGQSEQVSLTIHWAAGNSTQHQMVRTVGSYRQLTDYHRLCGRIDELRAEGRSMAEVAGCLNAEGFRPPKRAQRFTGGMVSGMLTRRCAGGPRNHKERVAAELSKGEWLLGELARYLGMPQTTLHRWRKAGWVTARKLAVPGGLWAIRATGPERTRLSRLRRFQREKPNQPIPAELTTPAEPKKK